MKRSYFAVLFALVTLLHACGDNEPTFILAPPDIPEDTVVPNPNALDLYFEANIGGIGFRRWQHGVDGITNGVIDGFACFRDTPMVASPFYDYRDGSAWASTTSPFNNPDTQVAAIANSVLVEVVTRHQDPNPIPFITQYIERINIGPSNYARVLPLCDSNGLGWSIQFVDDTLGVWRTDLDTLNLQNSGQPVNAFFNITDYRLNELREETNNNGWQIIEAEFTCRLYNDKGNFKDVTDGKLKGIIIGSLP